MLEKIFRIHWAGEGAPIIPHPACELLGGGEGFCIENVYRTRTGERINLDYILEDGESGLSIHDESIVLTSYGNTCPHAGSEIKMEISWKGEAAKWVTFEFRLYGDEKSMDEILSSLEDAGWSCCARY